VARYLAQTQIHRRPPRLLRDAPNNFLHLGLIHLMLPRIIDARRRRWPPASPSKFSVSPVVQLHLP
jgi:hypothetical protein